MSKKTIFVFEHKDKEMAIEIVAETLDGAHYKLTDVVTHPSEWKFKFERK